MRLGYLFSLMLGCFSLLTATLMSPKRLLGRKRTDKQLPEVIDLTADDEGSRRSAASSKRSRSSGQSPAVTAQPAADEVLDLTAGSTSPAAPAANGSGHKSRTEAASSQHAEQLTRAAPAATAQPATAPAPAVTDLEPVQAPVPAAITAAPMPQQPAMPQSSAKQSPARPADELPSWHKMKGAKRLQAELRYLTNQIEAGNIKQIHDVTPVGDNIFKWQLKLKDFDNDCEGGRNLNEDLQCLNAMHGQDHLLMEIDFPKDYPTSPFFLRMFTPRCVWYTGHVTAGGAICIEVLTQSGTRNSWTPQFCVESIISTVIMNMMHCESVEVRTASGPGGRSGPLRIDLQHRYAYNVMQQYTEYEAKAAFDRMLRHHRTNGW